jgi:hypothetical protein
MLGKTLKSAGLSMYIDMSSIITVRVMLIAMRKSRKYGGRGRTIVDRTPRIKTGMITDLFFSSVSRNSNRVVWAVATCASG